MVYGRVLSSQLVSQSGACRAIRSIFPSCSPLPLSLHYVGSFDDARCFPGRCFIHLLSSLATPSVALGSALLSPRSVARFLLASFSSSCQAVIKFLAPFTTHPHVPHHSLRFFSSRPYFVQTLVLASFKSSVNDFSKFCTGRPRPGRVLASY